jgi:hypothetical protein
MFATRKEKTVRIRSRKTGKVRTEKRETTEVGFWLPTEPVAFLVEQTNSAAPIVNAPWFLANTCRQLTLTNEQLGYGYYDFLGIKNRDDFFALARVRLKDGRDLERDTLEVAIDRRVSAQARAIDSEPTLTGWLFFTLDTDNETGRGNPVENLRRGDFLHKAEEHYLPLRNGLPAYLLCTDKGENQATDPDFIGSNTSVLCASTDKRIHVGVGCITCHAGQVLQPVNGWVRGNFTVNRMALNVAAFFRKEGPEKRRAIFEELTRQYLQLNFDNRLAEQREAYRRATREVCGLDAGPLAVRFARHYHGYADVPVNLDRAARDLGYTPEEVRTAFHRASSHPKLGGEGGIHQQLGGLVLDPCQVVPPVVWETLYPEAQRLMITYGPRRQ